MSGLAANGRVDQLMREDRGDLRRHRVGGVGEVRPDEYLEVAVADAPVVPALADRLALCSPAGEADRHPAGTRRRYGGSVGAQAEIERGPAGTRRHATIP